MGEKMSLELGVNGVEGGSGDLWNGAGSGSEVDSDSTLTLDPDTLTTTSLDKILELLTSALVELEETGDYLSYATLIEMYFENKQHEYSSDDKLMLLTTLGHILEDHHDIVYEIGWDLPLLLVDYTLSKWDLVKGLKHNPGILAIFKIYELLALYGNPKEIFLRSCELLNSIKFLDIDTENLSHVVLSTVGEEFHYKLISHSLLELLISSLNSIKTRYPSRFLSKLIITLINFVTNNFEHLEHSRLFIFRRIYVFTRQYSSLLLPDNIDSVDPVELAQNIEDENYLQRQLLTSFLTHFVGITIKLEVTEWVLSYYEREFHNPNSKFRLPQVQEEPQSPDDPSVISDDENFDALLLRCAQLALSMDIELEDSFINYLDKTETLFLNLDHSLPIDNLNDQVYSLVINDFNKQNSQPSSIPKFEVGELFLFTHLVNREKLYLEKRVVPISIISIIKYTIRLLIPSIIDPALSSRSVVDALLFWSWYCVKNDTKFVDSLHKIEPVFFNIYLQILISLASKEYNASKRMIMFTLITKLLTLSPEEGSYSFIVESIETCPYDNAKLALIGILKDLLIRVKSTKSLTEAMEATSLDSGKPKLPPREASTYIKLTEERKQKLLKLFKKQVDEFFNLPKKGNIEMSIILTFINLFISIKSKLSQLESLKLLSLIDDKVSKFKKITVKQDSTINIDLLTVAVESLKK